MQTLSGNVFVQGIDLEAGGRNKKTWRTAPKSENVYLKLLVKVSGSCGTSGRKQAVADVASRFQRSVQCHCC